MQGFRRAINAAIGDQLILKHFIVDLDADKVCEQRSTCQYMIEHLRTTVMQHGKATVGGQCTLDRGKHAPRQMSRSGVVLACTGQSQRGVVVFRVKVAANCNAGVGLGIEHALDRQSQLKRCPARLAAAAKKPSAQPDTVFQANGPAFCPGTAAARGARK